MQSMTIAGTAQALGVNVTRVHQYLRDGELVCVRDPESSERRVPAEFVQDGHIVKALRAVITLLRDARFDDPEIVEWLFRPDESLVPAGPPSTSTPIEQLRANRGGEIKRRAQAAGF